MKYVKSATRLLDRDLDLSKEVLWVSVGQRAPELQAIKVGGQQKILPIGPAWAKRVRTGPSGRIFLISNIDNWYLCCPLTYKDPQYLFRKI